MSEHTDATEDRPDDDAAAEAREDRAELGGGEEADEPQPEETSSRAMRVS